MEKKQEEMEKHTRKQTTDGVTDIENSVQYQCSVLGCLQAVEDDYILIC